MPLSLNYPNLIDLFCNGNKLAKLVLNPDIWRVYCENNNLTAIDASEATHISYTYSTDNYCIWASGNALYIEPDKNRRYDLSRLTEISGFDVNRAANWNICRKMNVLTPLHWLWGRKHLHVLQKDIQGMLSAKIVDISSKKVSALPQMDTH